MDGKVKAGNKEVRTEISTTQEERLAADIYMHDDKLLLSGRLGFCSRFKSLGQWVVAVLLIIVTRLHFVPTTVSLYHLPTKRVQHTESL